MNSTTYSILEEETAGCYVKTRYVLVLMIALGMVNASFLRGGISVAILNMVKTNPNSTAVSNETSSRCPAESGNSSDTEHNVGEFDWTITQQTTVLGCYFYGYMLMNIPGALLSKRYGIRKVVGFTFVVSSVLTLLIPTFAKLSFGLLIATRSLIGLLLGVFHPAMIVGLSDWSPPAERSRLVSFSFGSGALGSALIYPLAGIISSALQWEAVFFLTGGTALLWSILWLALVHDSPATHPRISENERIYIEESIGTKKEDKKRKIPWLKICMSPPVLGAIAVQLGTFWVSSVFAFLGPMYLRRVLQFNVATTGILSSLPFFMRFFTTMIWGIVADLMISSKFVTTLWVRKFSSFFPSVVSGLSMIAVAYLGCNKWPIIAFLTTSIGFVGMVSAGFRSTFIDIAPVYAGIIYSVSTTLTASVRFLAPEVSGALLVDDSLNSWAKVFWLTASISFAGGIAYVFLASDQVQDWAREPSTDEVSMCLEEEVKPLNDNDKEISCNQEE